MKKLEDLNRIENEVRSKDRSSIEISPIVLIVAAVIGIAIIVVLIKTLVFPSSPHIPKIVETNSEQQGDNYVLITGNESALQKQLKSDDEYTNIPEDTVLMAVSENDNTVFGSTLTREAIRKVTFVDETVEVPAYAWDISQSQNGTIMAWTEKTGLYNNLFIASKNPIKANENCVRLFAEYKNVITISFGNRLDTRTVTSMASMFKGCEQLQTLDLSSFDTHNVTSMESMFSGCIRLKKLNITGFDVSAVENMDSIVAGCPDNIVSSVTSELNIKVVEEDSTSPGNDENDASNDIVEPETGNSVSSELPPTQMASDEVTSVIVSATDETVFGSDYKRDVIRKIIFVGKETSVPRDAWDISESKDRSIMAWTEKTGIYYNLYIQSKLKIHADTNCSALFSGYKNVIAITFGDHFDTSGVNNMASMFRGCEQLQELDLSMFDTHNVENMAAMFAGCKRLKTLNLMGFNTSNVRDMSYMFAGCSKLNKVTTEEFDMSRVENASDMFSNCDALSASDQASIDSSFQPTKTLE